MMNMRKEKDSLGERMIPSDSYYGIQTLRAIENFPVSGRRERPELVKAYVVVKKAAALVNMQLAVIDEKRGSAIVKAADEIINGNLSDQFPVDLFQAGAGTSFNMNINEVIANRALEILGKDKGSYDYLNPNDHVNRSQSTNDTFPTASHIAILIESNSLLTILSNLAHAFQYKGQEFSNIPKSGRSHLRDAMPIRLGDEFYAYGSAIRRAEKRIHERRKNLFEVAIGGTAVGTGVNVPPMYRERVIEKLAELTSFKLTPAYDSLEIIQSRSQMSSFSGALKELALELIRIANDLRLMGSGPTAGLNEIHLPPVQPGSSFMPGKVNLVMPECLNIISFQVIGNDTAVSFVTQAGQLEINVMTPLMISNILESISLFNNFLPVFQTHCIEGILTDEKRFRIIAEMNPSLATLLFPKIGYLKAAEFAREAMETKQSIKDLSVMKGILTIDEADKFFNIMNVSKNRYLKEC